MTSQQLLNAQRELKRRRQANGTQYRPTSTPVCVQTSALPSAVPSAAPKRTLYHHGDIAVAAIHAGQSTHYQLWLALRWLDADGRGWLTQQTIQNSLSSDSANSTYLYKRPRLRQLLAEGAGHFWRLDRSNHRIFINKEARIALHLGIQRLTGRHVAIERQHLFSRIASFRANCFAAWLANRRNPISQATIERLTGIPPRTQLRYCKAADVDTTANIAIGSRYRQDTAQEAAWQHSGIFKFADIKGKQGPAGRRYVAWHLPTSYSSADSCTADRCSKRRKKRTNSHLAGLRTNRDAGNGRLAVLFFRNGAQAAKMANRQTPGDGSDYYWPGQKTQSKRIQLWHNLAMV